MVYTVTHMENVHIGRNAFTRPDSLSPRKDANWKISETYIFAINLSTDVSFFLLLLLFVHHP